MGPKTTSPSEAKHPFFGMGSLHESFQTESSFWGNAVLYNVVSAFLHALDFFFLPDKKI
jgi:hypothetical protein